MASNQIPRIVRKPELRVAADDLVAEKHRRALRAQHARVGRRSSRRTGCYQRRQPCAGGPPQQVVGAKPDGLGMVAPNRVGEIDSTVARRGPKGLGRRHCRIGCGGRRHYRGRQLGNRQGLTGRGAMGLCRCQSQRGHANDGRGPTEAMESDDHFVFPLGPRACDADLPRVVVIPILTHRLIPAGGASGNFALREVYPV